MQKGKNIICFANDWHNDPTSKHQIMKILSRENTILWINSISMRKPTASKADIFRIMGKLLRWLQGLERIHQRLYVFTPIVLPFPSSPAAQRVNAHLLRFSLWFYRKRLGMKNFQLWTFIPTMVELAGTIGEEKLIYYCVDEWSKFSFMDSEAMRNMEIRLIKKSDIVFVTADHLLKDKIQFNSNTHLITHGVDFEHFSRANHDDLTIPEDVKDIQKPILGFFGLIHEWIDLDLIESIAKKRPDWSIVLIGKTSINVDRLKKMFNIHFIGQRPYESLPAYCKAFDVGIIPFVINEMTLNVNPIKLREYLSAGLPVLSSRLPEVLKYSDLVQFASNSEEFIQKAEDLIKDHNDHEKAKRREQMAQETWEGKVEYLSSLIETF